MIAFLRRRWERNWPEISATLGGGMPAFVAAPRPRPIAHAVPVFVFHDVKRDAFEADLRFLRANGYTTITADALLDHVQGRESAPPRAIVLSFDDGAASLYGVVFPLLREYGCSVVAFVAPRYHHAAESRPGSARPCTWSEIREMHDSGLVDFQSHSLEHRYVPRWPEPVPLTGVARDFVNCLQPPLDLEEDFRQSREDIEQRLMKTVRHLAFPRGDGSDDALCAGARAGFSGFWWGMQRRRPLNSPGDDGSRIVRLSGEFVQRLPGNGRRPLRRILAARYVGAVRGWNAG
jgi:peptidoglycan/xylan/chitin deacetylase (PgdA/CDA1 family)